MFIKSYFDSTTAGYYLCAGTLSRALMWLVLPLATVMFPRIVHSVAKSEKTDLMKLVLLGTFLLAATGAVCLSVVGPWVITLMSGPAYVKMASAMLPWYAAAMVPLSLAYILLNNLMARSLFRVVPFLCLLAIGYAVALTYFHATPISVLKTLGAANLLLMLICAWFTWRAPKPVNP
jgi:O-antigen/teichoic acid export membrane protein